MKKLFLGIVVLGLLWCNSLSAVDNPEKVSFWIDKFNMLSNDKKLIFCIPVYEESKNHSLDLYFSVFVKELERIEKNSENNAALNSKMMEQMVIYFDYLYLHGIVAYLSMTKDSESYEKGKKNIKYLNIYQNVDEIIKLYSKENMDLFHGSDFLLQGSSVSVTKNKLLDKCTKNYLLVTKENERIKEILKDITTDEFKKIIYDASGDEWSKRLAFMINLRKPLN